MESGTGRRFSNQEALLWCSFGNGDDMEQLRRALAEGADVNQLPVADGGQDSLLHVAAARGNAEVVKLFLDHGAQVNRQNRDGDTPLHAAVACGQVAVCNVLMAHGAQVNRANRDGNTPLHTAAACGQAAICNVLVAHGADVDRLNRTAKTPLGLAANTQTLAVLTAWTPHVATGQDKAADAGRTAASAAFVQAVQAPALPSLSEWRTQRAAQDVPSRGPSLTPRI